MTDDQADCAAFAKLYGSKTKEVTQVPRKTDPKPGDKVRLSRIKTPFEKETTPWGLWSREYYTVKDVSTNQKIPMYKLLDVKGKPLEGIR